MNEVELKFQVPNARREALRRWVVGSVAQPARRQRLQAAYFDTPARDLARAGLALRLRREGLRWVQTLKGAGADGMTRLEHNVDLSDRSAALPALDAARHAGHPAGERLLALLASLPAGTLVCLFRTDIWRLKRPLRTRLGVVELAFDEGFLIAEAAAGGLQRLPVCELEIELLSGAPQAVLEVAQRHALRQGLWLDQRTKAQRGDMLARAEAMAPPVGARPAQLQRGSTPAQGLHAALLGCLQQILPNASQLADGLFTPEHLHQLRVGLRRLRSALALFKGLDPAADDQTLAELSAALFRGLGAARDGDVLREGSWSAELAAALRARWSEAEPVLASSAPAESPALLLRGRSGQMLLLTLMGRIAELAAAPEAEAKAKLKPALRRRLQRWSEAVRADAKRFAALDEAQRHRLRKRIKRLRYGLEFSAGLFESKELKRWSRGLAAAQEALGELNDLALALQQGAGDDDRRFFALGWLQARHDQRLRELAPLMHKLGKQV
ncbi:CYTH and CHAD domain-containing protein [Paucibacter sp. PLA-PC-4]|uniref:CYTH and CHAD domain-containing protein n=1 Tax=Paucibacter sp. PLA-PC-4 TaxID=2993655 RepID=UPI002248B0F0|nr:CYTH and CHAD domain-containing protein [Paucibacter sp. PLA-PC-4]MCX2860511.1 CYTH and CHAD domain-containing protein [Paucibacter sp. PLA-PC-4]